MGRNQEKIHGVNGDIIGGKKYNKEVDEKEKIGAKGYRKNGGRSNAETRDRKGKNDFE